MQVYRMVEPQDKDVKNKKGYKSIPLSFNRKAVIASTSFDHNIVDGAPAARFMDQLTETIKNGEVIHQAPGDN